MDAVRELRELRDRLASVRAEVARLVVLSQELRAEVSDLKGASAELRRKEAAGRAARARAGHTAAWPATIPRTMKQ